MLEELLEWKHSLQLLCLLTCSVHSVRPVQPWYESPAAFSYKLHYANFDHLSHMQDNLELESSLVEDCEYEVDELDCHLMELLASSWFPMEPKEC